MRTFSEERKRLDMLQQEIDQTIQEIKAYLLAEVSASSLPGINQIAPGIVVVKLSNLGSSWDHAYYCPQSQAEAVKRALTQCRTIDQVSRAVDDMLSCGFVRNGGYKVPLNPSTLEILRNSGLNNK